MRSVYGWFFLTKDIADYANCTYFEIMKKPAVEVLTIFMIMQAKASISNIRNTSTEQENA